MVQINFALREVSCKIVYYGPGMSGKTTNLEVVHQKAPEQNKGELTSISTDGDRTLFFDFMPLDLGTIAGMRTKFQLYTVPGQVYYNSTRKLVLQGVDGVIFVADSDPDKVAENLESLDNLEENLREYGKDLKELPHVIQFNKRDLPKVLSVEEMNSQLNRYGAPTFEGIAPTGQGVFPTLKVLAGLVLESINNTSDRRPGAKPVPKPVPEKPVAHTPTQPPTPAPEPMAAPQPQPQGTRPTMSPRQRPQGAPGGTQSPRRQPVNASKGATATQARPTQPSGSSADLKELMKNSTNRPRRVGGAAQAVEAPVAQSTDRRAARRKPAASGTRSRSNGTLMYGMVFGVLVAAVATAVVLYILK
ncbi:MAG: GTPase [Planctomycetes bacterium]|nr:GTPase [Planctomycetota bacterium]